MSDPALECTHVGLDYADGSRPMTVLRDASLALRTGEFVALTGPSGSGKSSLLFVLAGLRPASRGEVRLLGAPWSPRAAGAAERRRRLLGLVFQDPFLVSYLTPRENALVQALDPEARGRIDPLAADLGIAGALDRQPGRLSAGERQRASVMRALVNAPAVVLADEPTAHLDRDSGDRVVRRLAEAAREAALLVTTHDPRVLDRADRVLRLDDGALIAG